MNNYDLEGGETLNLYNMEHGSTIHISRRTNERATFQIFVKYLDGKTHTLFVHNYYTIEHISRVMISQIGANTTDPTDLRIIFSGRQLDYNETFSFYNIGSDTTLYADFDLRGGAVINNLVDVEKSDTKRRLKWSSEAERWRICKEGFSAEGICPPRTCIAYKNDVISNHSFGLFEMDGLHATCPICRNKVNVTNLGFNNCLYRIRAMKENSLIEMTIPWTKVGDHYETWDSEKAGLVNWKYMTIEVRKNDRLVARPPQESSPSHQQVNIAPVSRNCAICFKRLPTWDAEIECSNEQDVFQDRPISKVTMIECGHSFHSECWNKPASEIKSRLCPIWYFPSKVASKDRHSPKYLKY